MNLGKNIFKKINLQGNIDLEYKVSDELWWTVEELIFWGAIFICRDIAEEIWRRK